MAMQFCVVCGRGSTRPSWNNQIGAFVACDFHDQQEINWAVQNATTPNAGVMVVDIADEESPQV